MLLGEFDVEWSLEMLLLLVFWVLKLFECLVVDVRSLIGVVSLFLFCLLVSDGCLDFDLFILVIVELMVKEVEGKEFWKYVEICVL